MSHSPATIGRVKWFNNKQGYGFITVTEGSHAGEDIFVHHSAIQVGSEQFKYLVQGEYVHFDLVDAPEEAEHTHVSSNVCGVNGGQLMCETIHQRRQESIKRRNANRQDSTPDAPVRTRQSTRGRGTVRSRGRRTNGQTREG